jgi:uncharacterized protein (TIGR01440 family)
MDAGCDQTRGAGPEVDVDLTAIAGQLRQCLQDLAAAADLGTGKLLVVGASSSEVVGRRIGTATSVAVGRTLAETVLDFVGTVGCDVAFQCCEHLNRSLVVSRQAAERYGLREVTAIPVPGAGGAVAAVAYALMADACLVESVQADAGIDIGDTLIGMHLRPVVVPVRPRSHLVGQAHVTMARTRPPLIGGARAVYDADEAKRRLETWLQDH